MAKFYIQPRARATQQEGEGTKDLEVLMELLGLGSGQGKEETAARSQQAQQAYYEGLIGQQKAQSATELEKLGITKSEAAAAAKERLAAEAARRGTEAFQRDAALRDIQAKEDAQAIATLREIMGSTDFTKEEKRAAAMKVNPRVAAGIQEEMATAKKGRQEKFTAGLEKAYEGVGKDPKAIATFLKNQEAMPDYEEMLKSADWQRLNQGMPAPQPGLLSRLFGGGAGAGTQTAVTAPGSAMPVGSAPPLNPALAKGEAGRRASLARTTVQPEAEFEYLPGYPSAKPDYMYGIKTPIPADVVNRIETDPRYQSAEAELVKGAMDWWNKRGETPFRSMAGGPSAMPPTIQQPPELGFLENFLKQISDYAGSRPERVPAERYPYPIGHGVPPPVGGSTIDPRLLQP
jgi:hypothetical protein